MNRKPEVGESETESQTPARETRKTEHQLPEVSCCRCLWMTSLGGHTYPSALLKVNESSL